MSYADRLLAVVELVSARDRAIRPSRVASTSPAEGIALYTGPREQYRVLKQLGGGWYLQILTPAGFETVATFTEAPEAHVAALALASLTTAPEEVP